MNIEFNINEYVRVKLTEHGRQVHRKEHEEFWNKHGHKITPPYYAPKEDDDGWSKWQLWELMEKFGKHVGVCRTPCFETTIEFIKD